jgi:hypothetical protein
MTSPAVPASPPTPSRAALLLGGLIGLTTLALYARSLLFPMLMHDDFPILHGSWTWPKTVDALWVTHNEHAMPLGRLLAFGVIRLVPAGALPLAGVAVGVVSLLLGLALVYALVRRELGHPFYGLTAATLFGVTSVYQSCVYWFACSFWVLGLDTALLALLAAQRWRQTGRGLYLDLCALACLLAPGWYAGGVLAGPLCCLYLLPPQKAGAPLTPSPLPPRGERGETLIPLSPRGERGRGEGGGRFGRFAVTPLLGTLLFLAVSLPRTGEAIMHTPHYGDQTALEAFHPDVGLVNAGRSVVDNLLVGALGFYVMDHPLPAWLSGVVLAAAAAALGWWLWQAPDRRLIVLGLGFILFSYWLIFSARANWEYGAQLATGPSAGRYHLLPQLGLALVVCGGLPGRGGRWFRLSADGRLTRGQCRALLLLIGICFAVQAPRAVICVFPYHPDQTEALRALEAVDARCREHHISAATARAALPPVYMTSCPVSVWEFLRGSDDPRPVDVEDARRLLQGDE